MLNKIFWFFILIIILYLLLVFKAPTIAGVIEKSIGVKGLSEFVINFKKTYDNTVTKIPTEREVKDTYNVIYSGATDFREKFINGANITKGKIDTVREKISGAEDAYNELKEGYEDVKEGYNEAKEFIDDNSDKMDAIKKAIDVVSNKSLPVNTGSIDTNTRITSTGMTSTGLTNTGVTN